MSNFWIILWVVCVAFSPAYNILGEKMIVLPLVIPFLLKRKLSAPKLFFFSASTFVLYFLIKMMGTGNYNPISDFHSVYSLFIAIMEVFLFLLFLASYNSEICVMHKGRHIEGPITLLCFHVSLLITILILRTRGRDFYRDELANAGFFIAPQFYLIFSIFISMALTYLIIKKQGNKIVNFVCLAINLVYVMLANYTTQMIFFFAGIALMTVVCLVNTRSKRVIGTVLIIIATYYLYNYLPDIILYMNNNLFSDNPTLHMRLNEVYTYIVFKDAGTDLNGRFSLINMSLNTFKSYPFLGIPFGNYNSFSTGLVVGDHCEWIDDLARYGVIGMGSFLLFIIPGIKIIFDKFRFPSELRASITIMITMYGFSNPIIKVFLFAALLLVGFIIKSSEDLSTKHADSII